MIPRLKQLYRDEVVAQMMTDFGFGNVHEVPRLEKIVVNIGLGEAIANARSLDAATNDMALITGQKPVITRAKKSVAAFRLRAGMPIGAMVTLRGDRMYEFLDRLVGTALPRIRDFRGLPPRSFDGRGNYTLGLKEQLVFPEIEYDKVDAVRGLNISITTTAKTDEECKALLAGFRFPFKQ